MVEVLQRAPGKPNEKLLEGLERRHYLNGAGERKQEIENTN